MSKTHRICMAGVLAACLAAPLQAEEAWQHEIAPYIFAAGMDGKVGLNGVTADVDVGFSDILENLKFGGMIAYRASRGPVFFTIDLVYMKLEADKTGPNGRLYGDAEMDQTALEFDGGYKLTDNFSVFGGLRFNKIDADLKIRGEGPLGIEKKASGTETWLDPVVGAKFELPFGAHWSASLRGDIGGFGVGSDFAWQGVALVRWQPSEGIGVIGGYRYFDQDVDLGNPAGDTTYDMAVSGLVLGAVFTF